MLILKVLANINLEGAVLHQSLFCILLSVSSLARVTNAKRASVQKLYVLPFKYAV